MNKYSEIEIKTAENLLKEGYKWIIGDTSFYGNNTIIFALKERPHRNTVTWSVTSECRTVCTDAVPIFQSIRSDDKEPVSLESIVHSQILDDAEKRYLKGVIRPFRNRVEYISKEAASDDSEEFIHIELSDGDFADLPNFKANTMYKGMKLDYEYSLEKLGI